MTKWTLAVKYFLLKPYLVLFRFVCVCVEKSDNWSSYFIISWDTSPEKLLWFSFAPMSLFYHFVNYQFLYSHLADQHWDRQAGLVVDVSKNLCGSVGQWIRKAKSCNIAFSTENLYVCGWLWIFLSVSPTFKILFQLRTTLLTSTRIFSYLQIEKYRSQIFRTSNPSRLHWQVELLQRETERYNFECSYIFEIPD